MLPKDYLIIALLAGNFVFLWWLKNMMVCLMEVFCDILQKLGAPSDVPPQTKVEVVTEEQS